jgi:hypothetical protein
MKALTQAAQFMKVLYPPGHAGEFSSKAIQMTRELVADTITEERVKEFAERQISYAAREAMQHLPSLQEATEMWLNQYRHGRFEVKVDMSDLEPRIRNVRDIARTMTLGLLVVGVLLASAVAANAPRTGAFHPLREAALVVSVFALAVAAILIVVFAWRTIRGDRKGSSGRASR